MKIDFVSDVACPWCAVGLNSLEIALARLDDAVPVELHFQPFELNPDMPPAGEDAIEHLSRKYGASAEQLAASRAMLKERGAAVGFVFGDRARVWNTFDAHRLLFWAGLQGRQRELKHALLKAYHTRGQNPADEEVLVQCAVEAGLDAVETRDVIQTGHYADEVRAAETFFQRAGIRSVPAIIINEKHLISGGQAAGGLRGSPAADRGRPGRLRRTNHANRTIIPSHPADAHEKSACPPCPRPAIPTLFAALQPQAVWKHFATLCAIPRMSKHEERLREHIRSWAGARGLPARVDGAGNLIITKPASTGREAAPVLALQAHLDMVCQKNTASLHDFLRDPITPVLEGDWLAARDTTLGADDGIGVALILAVLEDRDLVHGPVEALLTVDEETGMSGAHGLAAGELHATAMLNLDTEEWGEFYLGCAGGADVNVTRAGSPQAMPAGHRQCRISLRGLRGGHSGVDIHEERGNAIKLLVRVLHELESHISFRLASLQGGTARNALAREAFACIAVPAAALASVPDLLARLQARLRLELRGVDDGLELVSAPASEGPVLAPAEHRMWLDTLHAAPHGVRRMSRQVPGVVETSNNLGMVDITADRGSCNFMVRSLLDQGSSALAQEIASLFALSGTAVDIGGQYPGWMPNPASPLLGLCQSVYRQEFGADSQIKVIHAGLECGIIGGTYPGMDIVSFGPTIRGAHAPGERVQTASVGHCWRLLTAILARAAAAPPARA